jgi:endonuclease/exonuclease/phosphatase family metal-dependent hydrolase
VERAGLNQLTLLTWNVWSSPYKFHERTSALLQEIQSSHPDIVALQEVTPELSERLRSCDWVRKDYLLSDPAPSDLASFELVLMFRRPPLSVRRIKLPSQMGRDALLAEFEAPAGVLAVATVHLDSMKLSRSIRGQQLAALFAELEPYDQALLLGDFNFCSSWKEENSQLDRRYRDLWSELCPGQPGYTEDTAINSMRLAQSKTPKQVRFDRILLRDDRARWRPCSIELLGREALGEELFVSDHFGLTAKLLWEEPANCLLLLGRDHIEYGVVSHAGLGAAMACLCVGSDKSSPSMAFKADPTHPNEDSLLVKRQDNIYLLAVSDAHFGIEASHRLLERLAAHDLPRSRLDLLKLCLEIQKPHEVAFSGTTLVVALYDEQSGQVIALSTGDSTLATLGETGWKRQNEHNKSYIRLDVLSYPDTWCEVELQLQPGEVLVLHTDGIDECHYNRPATSLTPERIEAIWNAAPGSSSRSRLPIFCRDLVQAALAGVEGYPGGQDNIALVALAHEGHKT